ncbi:hypothetical protein COOONC_03191 [Cooperia oncophora]
MCDDNIALLYCSLGWHVENGAPSEGPYIRPHGIISLTAPKLCVRDWTGPHFIGGRFVPKQLAKEHGLVVYA